MTAVIRALPPEPEAFVQDGRLSLRIGGSTLPDRLLLHCCCGPCAEWPLYYLRACGIEPTGLFYNPNIHPDTEWSRRVASYQELGRRRRFSTQVLGHSEEETWRGFCCKQKSSHCDRCYSLRLEEAAKQAKAQGYVGFTTSLLVSPYQDTERIHFLGTRIAERYGVEYFAFDFRPGYRTGQEMARRDGLYRQRFCGCIYSLGESSFCNKIAAELNLDPATLPVRALAPQGLSDP